MDFLVFFLLFLSLSFAINFAYNLKQLRAGWIFKIVVNFAGIPAKVGGGSPEVGASMLTKLKLKSNHSRLQGIEKIFLW